MWSNLFKSELIQYNLLQVVDPNVLASRVYISEEIVNKRALVRDSIINRIDSTYHKWILNLTDSNKSLVKLKEFKRIESNINSTMVWVQMYDLCMIPQETVT